MQRLFLILLGCVSLLCCAALRAQEPAQPGFDHEHALFTRVLARHATGDRLDYLALSRAHGDLDVYTAELCTLDAADFATWTKPQQCAFWMNAYNAFTLQAVLVNYPLEPLESLRDIGAKGSGGPWKRKNLQLGRLIANHAESAISLDELRDHLRVRFKDARVHAALNNSCRGAPSLRASAFTAAGLERELDAAAHAWLADEQRTRFNRQTRSVEASMVFDTFREDFVRDAGSVEAWITRYAPASERAWIELPGENLQRRTLAFDWRLNDVEPAAR